LHSGKPSFPDKEEVRGSSPRRPTSANDARRTPGVGHGQQIGSKSAPLRRLILRCLPFMPFAGLDKPKGISILSFTDPVNYFWRK
jgi:hypothetical protein